MIARIFGGIGRWLRLLIWRIVRTVLVSLFIGAVVMVLDMVLLKRDDDDEADAED